MAQCGGSLFFCRKCVRPLRAPVWTCPFGHCVSDCCRSDSPHCPVCSHEYTYPVRNPAIEALIQPFDATELSSNSDGNSEGNSTQQSATVEKVECVLGCSEEISDVSSHLIVAHDCREIAMERDGGKRAFTGLRVAWVGDSQWPQCIWRLETDALLVRAETLAGTFRLFLYRLSPSPLRLRLTISAPSCYLRHTLWAPVLSAQESVSSLHCETSLLLSSFLQPLPTDPELLRLWVDVRRA